MKVKLPKCSSCHYSFKWRELFIGLGPKECPQCRVNQFVTARKRRQGLLIGPIIAIAMIIILQVLNLSLPITLAIGVAIIVIAILLNPFSLEFTDEEEPLF